jgi:hypothetical protein
MGLIVLLYNRKLLEKFNKNEIKAKGLLSVFTVDF